MIYLAARAVGSKASGFSWTVMAFVSAVPAACRAFFGRKACSMAEFYSGEVVESGETVLPDYSDLCKYKIITRDLRVAVLGLGVFLGLGRAVVTELKETLGIDATLIDPRFITGLDEPLLAGFRINRKSVPGVIGEESFLGLHSSPLIRCLDLEQFSNIH